MKKMNRRDFFGVSAGAATAAALLPSMKAVGQSGRAQTESRAEVWPENGTLNSPAFGTTTSMANSSLGANSGSGSGFNPIFNTGSPRNFQFALKLYF